MTDASGGAPPPKKKPSFFKRAAWQDAKPNEGSDIFSHRDEFTKIAAEQRRHDEEQRKNKIVAEQQRRDKEQRKKIKAERKRNQEEPHEKKRRKCSTDCDGPGQPTSGSGSSTRPSRSESTTRSETPVSPAPSLPPSTSLGARYDTVTRSASVDGLSHKEPITIDLGDSEEDVTKGLSLRPGGSCLPFTNSSRVNNWNHNVSVQESKAIPTGDDDYPEERLNPTLAALAARARQSTAASTSGQQVEAPKVLLLVDPEIPGAKPLVFRVFIDDTLEKTMKSWLENQDSIFPTPPRLFLLWSNTRLYDTTTVTRLGISVDTDGLISIEGDSNIYSDANPPKLHVRAWTEELYQQRKKADAAAEVAAKQQAAEPSPMTEEREPTPQLPQQARKTRLVLKARGREDVKLTVNADTTFGHIAAAYKQMSAVDESQPVTLMFDNERLPPMDTIADTDLLDLDSIEVLFK